MSYRVINKMKWVMKWMTRTKQREAVTNEGQKERVINMWFEVGKIKKDSPVAPPVLLDRRRVSVGKACMVCLFREAIWFDFVHYETLDDLRHPLHNMRYWQKGRPRSLGLGKDGLVWKGKVVCMKDSRKDLRKCLCRVTDATTSNTYSCQ